MHEPRLVLLDEPFTGLDEASPALVGRRLRCAKQRDRAAGDPRSRGGRTVCRSRGRAARGAAPPGSSRSRRASRAGRRACDGLHRRSRCSCGSGVAWLVVAKDLTVEVRSREIVSTTLFFAVSCVLVFAFSVRPGRPGAGACRRRDSMAIAFSGTLALGRAFERERQSETLRAAARPDGSPRDLRRQTGRPAGFCWQASRSSSCRSSVCCSRRRLPAHPLLLARLLAAARSGSSR